MLKRWTPCFFVPAPKIPNPKNLLASCCVTTPEGVENAAFNGDGWTKNPLNLIDTPTFEGRFWLVVSTHLKNISQNGNLPQIGVKIKHVWNHHLGFMLLSFKKKQQTHHDSFFSTPPKKNNANSNCIYFVCQRSAIWMWFFGTSYSWGSRRCL